MPKKNKKKVQKNIATAVQTFFKKNNTKSFNYKQICAQFGISDASGRNHVIKILTRLTAKKELIEIERGKYKSAVKASVYEGYLDATKDGNAYIISDQLEDDVFVREKNRGTATDGDLVKILLFNSKTSRRKEAEVIEIIKRKTNRFVGILQFTNKGPVVFCGSDKPHFHIKQQKEIEEGQKVVIEVENWGENGLPSAKILKILGLPGTHQAEIHGILEEFNLPYVFSDDVLAAATNIDTHIKKDEIKNRRDFRSTLTFTIDPHDAKDFDDAISYKVLENNNIEVGVHIADVSYYLATNTILEEEAEKRATSVYLVDRVVPMLPEVLSNQVCSLRPNEDKLCFSAVFEIDQHAQIINEWYGKTIINSDKRLAYEEAEILIETKKNIIPENISLSQKEEKISNSLLEAILDLHEKAKKIRKRRMQSGAISFDKIEVRFQLNEEQEPTDVFIKQSKNANKLIEEYMLLANKKVAEFIANKKPEPPFVYRIHDEPDVDKLANLQRMCTKFGYKIQVQTKKQLSNSINKLLKDIKGTKEQNLIDTLAIRSMSKAEYSTKNIGHYGLAFDHYTHFTSPIRRYPDVLVHRLLEAYLLNQKTTIKELESKCKHSSFMEQVATKAERNSIKYMQVKYVSKYIGKEFDAVISGVIERGIFIELIESKCEGMIRLKDIPGDYYHFDPQHFSVIGSRTKKVFQLGDAVRVKILEADLVKKQIEMTLTAYE